MAWPNPQGRKEEKDGTGQTQTRGWFGVCKHISELGWKEAGDKPELRAMDSDGHDSHVVIAMIPSSSGRGGGKSHSLEVGMSQEGHGDTRRVGAAPVLGVGP